MIHVDERRLPPGELRPGAITTRPSGRRRSRAQASARTIRRIESAVEPRSAGSSAVSTAVLRPGRSSPARASRQSPVLPRTRRVRSSSRRTSRSRRSYDSGNHARYLRVQVSMRARRNPPRHRITGDAPANVDFYARVLGLRMVKKTVNQDDPTVYHLFYADEDGRAGADITFFEYPGAPRGRAGDGMVHRVVFRVAVRGGARLLGRAARRRARRTTARCCFDDPEGLGSSCVVDDAATRRSSREHPEVPAEHALQGFDGVRAYAPSPSSSRACSRRRSASSRARRGWVAPRRRAPRLLRLRRAAGRARAAGRRHRPPRRVGVADGRARGLARARRSRPAARPTPVIDRFWFRSIYFREPSGVLFEIATLGPGFTTDEPLERSASSSSLPPASSTCATEVEPPLTPLPHPREHVSS